MLEPITRGLSMPIVRHIVAIPKRPEPEKTIFACLQNQDRQHWKNGLFHQYDKNARMMLLSQPIPREKLPQEVKVFPSVIACRIKEKGKHLYKFETRHCVNGAPMVQGIHFDFSYAPTASQMIVKALSADEAATGKHLSIVDVENCFQNDTIPADKRIFITAPPLYLEWFKRTYPEIKIDEASDKKYVLQTINGMQGRKDAGRNWYLLLKQILEDFGFACLLRNQPSSRTQMV